jgi:hypothetical protein
MRGHVDLSIAKGRESRAKSTRLRRSQRATLTRPNCECKVQRRRRLLPAPPAGPLVQLREQLDIARLRRRAHRRRQTHTSTHAPLSSSWIATKRDAALVVGGATRRPQQAARGQAARSCRHRKRPAFALRLSVQRKAVLQQQLQHSLPQSARTFGRASRHTHALAIVGPRVAVGHAVVHAANRARQHVARRPAVEPGAHSDSSTSTVAASERRLRRRPRYRATQD